MTIEEKLKSVNSKTDFISFIEHLVEDLKNNPDRWVNLSLSDYLESISNWTEDMEGYYLNNDLPYPININWKVFAEILYAAKMYE